MNIGKTKKPRDTIQSLQKPSSTSPRYEERSDKMASIARDYYDDLQNSNEYPHMTQDERTEITEEVLGHIVGGYPYVYPYLYLSIVTHSYLLYIYTSCHYSITYIAWL